jgi:hypothetical protein
MNGGNMETPEDIVKCTKCGSTQVHAEKRGFSMIWGTIGSRKIFITCLKCGNRFKPGDAPRYSAYSAQAKEDTQTGLIALVMIALVILLLMKVCS